MGKYWPGLNDALSKVNSLDVQGCLEWIDMLYGRHMLKYGDELPELQDELKRQIRLDFTKPKTQWEE